MRPQRSAFRDIAGEELRRFRLLKDLGNKAVHRVEPIRVGDAVLAATELFHVLRLLARDMPLCRRLPGAVAIKGDQQLLEAMALQELQLQR